MRHRLSKSAEAEQISREPALRALVYRQGLQSEEELTEAEIEPKAGGADEAG